MLQLKDVRYPISFVSSGNGTVTFESVGCGRWDDGQATECPIEYFIQKHNGYAPGDYECKTGIDAVIFPIVFMVDGGAWVAFGVKGEKGINSDGTTSPYDLKSYLSDAHEENPENTDGKCFHFIMGADAQKFIDEHPAPDPKDEDTEVWRKEVVSELNKDDCKPDSGRCPIERMPLGAIIQQVCNLDGDMVDFHFAPNRIEVHDDEVTLLNKQRGFTAELSLHRGCIVQWEMAEIPVSELPF